MSHAPGRCTNIDYCSIADARQLVAPHVNGALPVCPECAGNLMPPAGKAPGIVMPALAALTMLLASVSALYAGVSQLHISQPLPATAAHPKPSVVAVNGIGTRQYAQTVAPLPAPPSMPTSSLR